MGELKKLSKISDAQIKTKGVQSLADRPNKVAQYGSGGLSATQLKLYFDKLATFLAQKINEIQNTLAGDGVENEDGTVNPEAAEYIHVPLEDADVATLKGLVDSFTDGSFASKILKLYPSASGKELCDLQTIINELARLISKNSASFINYVKNSDVENSDELGSMWKIVRRSLQGNIIVPEKPTEDNYAASKKYADDIKSYLNGEKVSKITNSSTHPNVYAALHNGNETLLDTDSHSGNVVRRRYPNNGNIAVPLTPSANDDAASKHYVDSMPYSIYITQGEDYKYTIGLKDKNGVPVAGSCTIDLPLESCITNIEEVTTEGDVPTLKFTLRNGQITLVKLDDVYRGFIKPGQVSQTSFLQGIIVARNAGGQILVPEAPTEDGHAASKGYVDSKVDNTVDKTDESYKIYGTDKDGKQIVYDTDGTGSLGGQGYIARRTTNGNILLPEMPTEDNHATSKKYVDDNDAAIKTSVDTLKKQVANLEGATLEYTEDTSAAYVKTVPENAEKYALVNKIGGMSRASNNLIPFPYFHGAEGTTRTVEGVDCTVNDNGSVTLKGASTVTSDNTDAYFTLFYDGTKANTLFPAGTYKLSGGIAAHGDYSRIVMSAKSTFGNSETSIAPTVTLSEGDVLYQIRIHIEKGGVYNDTIYPMLNRGDTALPYEPYFAGLRSASVEKLVSHSANLIPYPYTSTVSGGAGTSVTKDGVTYTVQEDGSILVNGTNTQSVSSGVTIYRDFSLDKDAYISGIPSNATGVATLRVQTYSGNVVAGDFSGAEGYKVPVQSETLRVIVLTHSLATVENVVFRPMLNYGDTALPFSLYKEPVFFDIPQEVQAIEGYGLGVNDTYYNYIDYERKVFVQNVYRKVFNGTETLTVSTTTAGAFRYKYETSKDPIVSGGTVNCVCNHYPAKSVWYTNDYAVDSLGTSNTGIYWVDTAVQTGAIADMQAKLKTWYEEGNPLIVDYILAEPIETDISEYLTDYENYKFIETEQGGSLVFENKYGYDVPSTVSFVSSIGG